MHKHTKLGPALRVDIYRLWCDGASQRSLAREYHVDKKVISRIVSRGRKQDFTVHDSTNHRYREIEYGLKKLAKTEAKIARRQERERNRYEKSYAGEMVHADDKLLPRLAGETKGMRRERLFVAVDDASRHLVADILPDKTQESAECFGRTVVDRAPYDIEIWYTDRGTEWKGNDEHDFVSWCANHDIVQQFTRPRRPQTNGKAERVIRTLMEMWHTQHRFVSREDRRKSLYQFVDWYNHEKPHAGLKGYTPVDRLRHLIEKRETGDNA